MESKPIYELASRLHNFAKAYLICPNEEDLDRAKSLVRLIDKNHKPNLSEVPLTVHNLFIESLETGSPEQFMFGLYSYCCGYTHKMDP